MPRVKAAGLSVELRLYRQGLGDCFLLSFKQSGRPEEHMLIDCGVLTGTPEAEAKMCEVVQDIKQRINDRPLHVVATHEHWDHLSGFVQARDIFKQMRIDDLWLAWTENPDDALAKSLREKRAQKVQALRQALNLSSQRSALSAVSEKLAALSAFYGELAAAGGVSTQKALSVLVNDLAHRRVKYLYPGDQPALPGIDGVRVYVMGPPRDVKSLSRDTPRKGEAYESAEQALNPVESFMAAVERGLGEPPAPDRSGNPFDSNWELSEEAATDAYALIRSYRLDNPWRQIDDEWLANAATIALNLDGDTNNTSLVLAIELVNSGKVLLFAADAQAGNWSSWADLRWEVEDGDHRRQVTAQDLLRRTVFYKVGHHGSHNATLSAQGLELMTDSRLTAVIAVDVETARAKKWMHMPFEPLVARLEEKTGGRVIQTDLQCSANKKLKELGLKEGSSYYQITFADSDGNLPSAS